MVKQDKGAAEDANAALLLCKAAGETIFLEGDSGAEMFIVEQGTVEIFKERAGATRILQRLEPGDFFGEMAVLEGRPRAAGARAATDIRLLPIDASTLDALLREHPEIGVRMLRKLALRVRRYEEQEEAAAEAARSALRGAAPRDVPSGPAQPEPAPAPAVSQVLARLVHEATGREFLLHSPSESVVGRFDPVTETSPEIDVGEIDTQRTTSRRHARVTVRDGKLYVREEVGTANGTWLGQERLANGVEREIADGDRLRFGLVDLVVRVGGG